jgi:hypothetical protein
MFSLCFQNRSSVSTTNSEVGRVKEYHARFAPLFARRDSWSRRDREEVFNLILDVLRENSGYNFDVQMDHAWNIFYEKGGCPFDTVSEAAYQPPLYGGDKASLVP